jgi:hypothetical protein
VSRQALVRGALALAVLGLCAAGFFACFEKREVEIEKGVSSEVRRNRYLALGRLLERMGHTVVVESNPTRLSELPEPPATLILPTSRASIGAERSQALLDWASRGGHLAVVTYSLWLEPDSEDDDAREPEQPDLILDRFGLRQWAGLPPEPEQDEDEKDEAEKQEEPPEPPSLEDLFTGKLPAPEMEGSWAVFDAVEPLEVGFSPNYRWLDPEGVAVWSVAGPSGVHLIELRHGRGRISAFTSDEPLLNDWIGERDNAEFVVRWLRRDATADGPIWILFEEDWPSVFALLRRHGLPALIAGSILLAAWVWSAVFRFGPVLPEPPRARRSWLEHLDAAGRFHWRQDHGRALLAGMREEVARRLRERHPGWRELPERARAERIAERAGLSLAEVEYALAGAQGGARSFAASVSALERIRAAL